MPARPTAADDGAVGTNGTDGALVAADEHEHPEQAVETWWWWGWTEPATAGWFVGLELRGRRFDYWAGLVRHGQPYLYLAELDGAGRRAGLELKPAEMWADHVCDAPFEQWSLGNEGYGVLLDDPGDACGDAFGRRVPVAMDIEWGAVRAAERRDHGYVQDGEFDAVVELTEGDLHLAGPARRLHLWGVPHIPSDLAAPYAGLRAPYRRSDGRCVLQVLGSGGWLARTVAG